MVQIFELKAFTHILKTATWPAEYFMTECGCHAVTN